MPLSAVCSLFTPRAFNQKSRRSARDDKFRQRRARRRPRAYSLSGARVRMRYNNITRLVRYDNLFK